MDYSKITLANERNEHVTKRLNRLSTWKFFKVIYRENIWRMFGYNFLMILCMVPIFILLMVGSFNINTVQHTLPLYNGFGFSTGAWFGGAGDYPTVEMFFASQIRSTNAFYGAMTVLAALVMTFMFSGGFAVIRDAFWTGKLGTVGVFKSMWLGIKSNLLYAFASTAVIASSIFGIYEMFVWLNEIVGILWLAIVVTVVLSIVAFLVAMYLMILCSVSVTYKQSLGRNLDDAWRLMWLNIIPNILHLIVALIPVALYFIFGNSVLQQIYLIVMIMFGGLYFPLVWHTHMMKTFALFHPVEVKKKKKSSDSHKNKPAASQLTAEPALAEVTDEITEEDAFEQQQPANEADAEPNASPEEAVPDESEQPADPKPSAEPAEQSSDDEQPADDPNTK